MGETTSSFGKRVNSTKGVEVDGGGHLFFGVEHKEFVSPLFILA